MSKISSKSGSTATSFPIQSCLIALCFLVGIKHAVQTFFEFEKYAVMFLELCLFGTLVMMFISLSSMFANVEKISDKKKIAKSNSLDMVPTASRGKIRKGRTHNFSAGPSCIFQEVLETAHDEFMNYNDLGMSFMECSHRDVDGPVQTMMKSLVSNIRTLLKVPDNYHVLFFQGGAHAQFSAVPLNLIGKCSGRPKMDLVDTGIWSKKAAKEHSKWVDTNTIYNAEDDNETTIRPVSEWKFSKDAEYVHCTTNETMSGLEFLTDPDVGDRILCADMTSTLLSRPVDISKYGIIYASSGKNLGPAGATCVIVRDDLLDRSHKDCPSIINYKQQATSMPIPNVYNTPPTYILYLINLTCQHLLDTYGTLEEVERRAIERANKVYDTIDNSDGFYRNNVDKTYRSRMNAVFRIKEGDRALEQKFTDESAAQGLEQLFGHPLMGGNRITLYNAIHDDSVDLVVDFMKRFADKYR